MLALISWVPRIKTIVDIVGLAVKTNIELIEGILIEIPKEFKIDVAITDVSKTIVLKNDVFKIDVANLVEEGRVCSR